jgi:hypothetical protein
VPKSKEVFVAANSAESDGTRTMSEIIEELGNQYGIANKTLAQEVLQYIENLRREGLLEWI